MLAKIRFYFLSTAFLRAFIALSKTERGSQYQTHGLFPRTKILPSFSASPALSFEQVYEFIFDLISVPCNPTKRGRRLGAGKLYLGEM